MGTMRKRCGTFSNVYPREELWQIEREDLLRNAKGVLHLIDRPRPRAFARRDRFNRFVSVLDLSSEGTL